MQSVYARTRDARKSIKRFLPTFNFAKHRRPEHYKLISEQAGVKVDTAN